MCKVYSPIVVHFTKQTIRVLFYNNVQIETQLRYIVLICGSAQFIEVEKKKDGHWKANTKAKQVFLVKIASFAIFFFLSRFPLSTFSIHAFNWLHSVFFSSRQFVTYSFISMENMCNGMRINTREEPTMSIQHSRLLVHSLIQFSPFFVLIKIFQTFANSKLLSTKNSFKIVQCRTKFAKLIALFDMSQASYS